MIGRSVSLFQRTQGQWPRMPPVPVPKLFMPHPNFSDEVNRNIV